MMTDRRNDIVWTRALCGPCPSLRTRRPRWARTGLTCDRIYVKFVVHRVGFLFRMRTRLDLQVQDDRGCTKTKRDYGNENES